MYKYIFVDCFDTIIKRKVSPNTIKYLWAEKMSKYYNLTPNAFFRLFLGIETNLVQKSKKSGKNGEWDFDEFCDELFTVINLYKLLSEKIDRSEFVFRCNESYFEVERDSHYINYRVLNKIKKLKNNGSKIMLVSDFYCGKEIIVRWLKNLNIISLFDGVYSSCDLKMSKRSGTIYKYLLDKYNLNSKDVLMIGDNKISDYAKAKENGIKAIHICANYKKDNMKKLLRINTETYKKSKEYLNIYKANKDYSNYAFSLYYFTVDLYNRVKLNKTKNLFFLSREGEFLKKIFDYYLNYIGDNSINTHYLQMSRNSILLAGLDELEKENFDCVIREKSSITIKEFLTTLQMDNNLILKISKNIGLDINKSITNFTKTEMFGKLISNKDFIDYYNSIKEKQNRAFGSYLQSFGVDFFKSGIDIVDVGWKGTMQDLLYKYFDGKVKINGYYLGLNNSVNIQKNNIKTGLLYSNYPFNPSYTDKLFGLKIIYFEQVLKASHNRVKGYLVKNDKIHIEYDNEHDESSFYNVGIKHLQDRIYNKFTDLCKVNYTDVNELRKVCANLHFKMIFHTNFKDFKWLNNSLTSHYDSFARIGSENTNKLAVLKFFKFKLSNLKYWLKLIIKG